ncbi:MAG: rhodanese-like domain-containing protein [Alphaproteobacteria bacterium]|nr:rhodanese-like domain-containing protein [Alphaproteobacteria bacterium]
MAYDIKQIDPHSVRKWLESNAAVLIDVRELAEYNAERIPGSHHIPLSQISMTNLPSIKGRKIVIHCHSGKRSYSACEKLLDDDPMLEVCNLAGGILAWRAAELPTTKSSSPVLPLDQQVQIGAGLFILLTLLLGYGVSSYFYLVTAMPGIGLIIAGFTGWCGLGMVLTKMPWNQK